MSSRFLLIDSRPFCRFAVLKNRLISMQSVLSFAVVFRSFVRTFSSLTGELRDSDSIFIKVEGLITMKDVVIQHIPRI